MVWYCSQYEVTDNKKKTLITDEDLSSFMKRLDETDGGPAWQLMMDRSATNVNYQAWRRDPEVSFDESALEMFAFCVPEI
jgi:hypothetical protein